jgi:hypothetical protein
LALQVPAVEQTRGGKAAVQPKKEGVNEKADLKLLAARGLKSWDDADEELKGARKQARTDAKGEFLRAAGQALKALKAFVEEIGDVEHPKWAMEEKRTICHKAVELRHELRKVFGALVTLGPSGPYFMGDEAPPGAIYADPLTTTPPIYEEETLDEEELASGKLKKATVEDQLNRAIKKTKVSIAEPEDTSANDKDNDVRMCRTWSRTRPTRSNTTRILR